MIIHNNNVINIIITLSFRLSRHTPLSYPGGWWRSVRCPDPDRRPRPRRAVNPSAICVIFAAGRVSMSSAPIHPYGNGRKASPNAFL